MKNSFFYLFLLALIVQSCSDSTTPGFTSLFDGKNWTGWEGSKDFFRIEDKSIVAGTLDGTIPTNQFLCTEKTFADFELRMQVKFAYKNNNAGIQFRSSRIPDHHEVIGYQADVGYAGDLLVWGALYDESRRKRFLTELQPEKINAALKPDDWNDYRIYCKGPSIKFWLNDRLVLEYEETEDEIAKSGVICVQIHGGQPAEAWYRGIEIRELRGEADVK